MKKLATFFVLIVCVAFLSISFKQIGTVKADDYVFIRENRRIEGTNKIERVGNVYTFTDDIFEGIIVEGENLVIDAAGYTLQGSDSECGIRL